MTDRTTHAAGAAGAAARSARRDAVRGEREPVDGSLLGYPLRYNAAADYCECIGCSTCGAWGNPDYYLCYIGIKNAYFCCEECAAGALQSLIEYRRRNDGV